MKLNIRQRIRWYFLTGSTVEDIIYGVVCGVGFNPQDATYALKLFGQNPRQEMLLWAAKACNPASYDWLVGLGFRPTRQHLFAAVCYNQVPMIEHLIERHSLTPDRDALDWAAAKDSFGAFRLLNEKYGVTPDKETARLAIPSCRVRLHLRDKFDLFATDEEIRRYFAAC